MNEETPKTFAEILMTATAKSPEIRSLVSDDFLTRTEHSAALPHLIFHGDHRPRWLRAWHWVRYWFWFAPWNLVHRVLPGHCPCDEDW